MFFFWLWVFWFWSCSLFSHEWPSLRPAAARRWQRTSDLQADYPNTLSCPCRQIAITHDDFLSITPTYHQVRRIASGTLLNNPLNEYLSENLHHWNKRGRSISRQKGTSYRLAFCFMRHLDRTHGVEGDQIEIYITLRRQLHYRNHDPVSGVLEWSGIRQMDRLSLQRRHCSSHCCHPVSRVETVLLAVKTNDRR